MVHARRQNVRLHEKKGARAAKALNENVYLALAEFYKAVFATPSIKSKSEEKDRRVLKAFNRTTVHSVKRWLSWDRCNATPYREIFVVAQILFSRRRPR